MGFFLVLLLNKGREHSNQEQTFKWCPSTSCKMQQFNTEIFFFGLINQFYNSQSACRVAKITGTYYSLF